ncbi:hypothetical protein H4R35_001265 [Dimargaris xerosporica]|nr:hypothetical protein H4R35_001265 [Dimargaris xerosporica]
MPSTEHVVFVPIPATGELDWAQLKQRGQVKLSADGQQVLLAPRTSAIHLQHSHGTVGDSADVQLPWPSLLAQVDLTATAGWSALLDSCQGGSNPVDRPRPVVDGSSSWVSRWLSQPGVHVRIQMHASPAATLEHTALVQAIPTVSALLNSATPDGNDGAPQSDRLARLVADPKAWVQLSPTDYYLYVDSWAVPGTPANTMPMDWLARMSQRRPWFDRSNHVVSFDHTLYWTLSLSAASSQTMAWAAWSWSTLPADGLQVSLCDNQQDSDSTQCDDLTLMTSTTHANTATYQGLSIQRSTDGLRPKALHFADTLPPVSMTSQVTVDPPSSLHPHMVTSFLAASALEHTNLEDRTCQPKLLYHIAPVLFADPYQLADQTPVLGPFHHYGPIELEKPVDLVSAWGSVVTLDAPLLGLTKSTTAKARSNDAPAVNDGDVQVGRVDLPLHTRYKLPTFNTSTTAMGSQVYSFIRRPMAFVQCYDGKCER